jgi:DNA primase
LRASFAERERKAAGRIAVAEERSAIARELHDIVAHAMSVMVLQVGAVRHRLPESRTEDKEALGRVEQAGRTALAEMRRLLGAAWLSQRLDGHVVRAGDRRHSGRRVALENAKDCDSHRRGRHNDDNDHNHGDDQPT